MTNKTEEQLAQALREAMEWNWLDEDMPSHVHRQCEKALAAHEAAKSEGVSYGLLQGLTKFLEKEMPEGTVIGDPKWWAKRIALRAILISENDETPHMQQTEAQARDAERLDWLVGNMRDMEFYELTGEWPHNDPPRNRAVIDAAIAKQKGETT